MSDVASRRVFSVREFTNGIARWFASKSWLNDIAISGEISEARALASGQTYFKLKDGLAILECVYFPDPRRAQPTITNGSAVIASGRIGIREERSGYQLIVESVEPTGIGALFAKYEALKAQLLAEGLFDVARKRPVPRLLRRIALISARGGKGAVDFESTIRTKVPFVGVTFIESRVQGADAEQQIASALAAASRLDVDAIVLARGGGSYEELFPFNLEAVVRAIVAARHPVITAIGHDPDHHLADDVADMQFGTPSKAAEYIAAGWLAASVQLDELVRNLDRAGATALGRRAQALQSLRDRTYNAAMRVINSKRVALKSRAEAVERGNPQRVLADRSGRFVVLDARLNAVARRTFDRVRRAQSDRVSALNQSIEHCQTLLVRKLERALASLDRLDPQAPLRRGYAIVTKSGLAVTSARELLVGDRLEARFGRGTAEVCVEVLLPDG